MTAPQRNGIAPTGFSAWVRNNPRLDSQREGFATTDIDYIWHQFKIATDKRGSRCLQNIMLIEEKSHSGQVSFAQHDTISIMHQLLNMSFGCKGRLRGVKLRSDRREWVRVRYWGYHLLQYDGDCLETSAHIGWNRKPINLQILEEILRFERHPRTLEFYADRRHHAARPLTLFPTEAAS